MRRIFARYREGESLAGIARKLNQEGIPSPRVGTRHKHTGWGSSTIRAMLYNERYIGVWKFKETQWVKVPGTNKRRPRKRDESEVIRIEHPELRIVEERLWDDVQARLIETKRKYTKGKKRMGRPSNGGSRYLLSSLLYCGECNAPMTITSGSSAAYYRCSLFRRKGTCSNGLSIREDLARAYILRRVREMLMSREILVYALETAARKLQALSQRLSADLDERRHRLAQTERRIGSLVELLADGERSAYVRQSLRDLEAQAKADKQTIADLEAQIRAQAAELPDVEEVLNAAFDLNQTIQNDVNAGREHLRRLFRDGKITLTPDGDHYVATAQISPFAPLAMPTKLPPNKKPRESNDSEWFHDGSGYPLPPIDWHRIPPGFHPSTGTVSHRASTHRLAPYPGAPYPRTLSAPVVSTHRLAPYPGCLLIKPMPWKPLRAPSTCHTAVMVNLSYSLKRVGRRRWDSTLQIVRKSLA